MNKIDALVAKAQITATDHVLEVGCGWGAFAIRAASTTGCRVTGITISEEQFTEARLRVKAAGLEDRVDITFCDYRELENKYGAGCFDKAVSCEMIEAVGHEHFYCPHRAAKFPPLHRAIPVRIHVDELLHCAPRLAPKRVAQQPARVLAGGDVAGSVSVNRFEHRYLVR